MNDQSNGDTLTKAMFRVCLEIGLKQSEFAKAIGTQESEVTRLKKGERDLRAREMEQLAKSIGVPLTALVARAMKFIEDRTVAGECLAQAITQVVKEVEIVLETRRRELAA